MALSFLPARAVGVVGDAAFSITFVDDITVTVIFSGYNLIID